MTILLDTHVWLWWLTGAGQLASAERNALNSVAEKEKPAISAISLWEAEMLVTKGRLQPLQPFEGWLRRMADSEVVNVLPLDVNVVSAAHQLPASFHGDPADRLIVATSRAHAIPLATHDAVIRRSRVIRLWNA